MYEANQFVAIDNKYFNVLSVDTYDISLQSKNTGHYWVVHEPVDTSPGMIVIFHAHTRKDKYHKHGFACTLKQALRDIKRHDIWQMNGRPSCYR